MIKRKDQVWKAHRRLGYFPSPGTSLPREFQKLLPYPNCCRSNPNLSSAAGEASNPRPGEEALVGTPGPADSVLSAPLRTLAPRQLSLRGQNAHFLGEPAARSQVLSPDRRRVQRGDQAPRRRLRREIQRWLAEGGLGHQPHASQPRVPYCRQTSSFFSFRAISTPAFSN